MIFDRIKASAVWLIDRVHFDPFEEPIRQPESGIKLSSLVRHAEAQIELFWMKNYPVLQYRLPPDGSVDRGDQALWHGIYCAAVQWRSDVTLDPVDDRFNMGLELHQRPHLIRGIDESGQPEEQASNDSATGHLLGLYTRSTVSMPAMILLNQWAQNVYENKGRLINSDGTVTKYGMLENGILTDPLRASLLIALYAGTYASTKNIEWKERAEKVAKRHGALLRVPYVRFAHLNNWEDLHRAAIHLHIIYTSRTLPKWDKVIKAGADRLMKIAKREDNAWAGYLLAPIIGLDTNWPKEVLKEFSVTQKEWTKPNDVSDKAETVIWQKRLMGKRPVPLNMRGSQDFYFQRRPYSVKDWIGVGAGDYTRHNSGDLLATYWLGRKLGYLTAGD